MLVKNAKIYSDGKFIPGVMEYDEKVKMIRLDEAGTKLSDELSSEKVIFDGEIVDAGGCYVIPGLIDIHTHGGRDADAGDGNPDALKTLSEYYASEGVTSWCPTTGTLHEEPLLKAVKAASRFTRPVNGAKLAGFNLEGPFLSPGRAGAQDPMELHLPDISYFNRINESSGGIVRLVSVAPELDGAMEFIKEVSKTATVSLGHTNADYDVCVKAFENGASHITHTFNCMQGIHHRDPGTIPAALECGATAELITDGLHIHPAIVRMTVNLFGNSICFITDSLRCAGMPDGNYTLGNINVTKIGGRAVLTETLPKAGTVFNKAPTLAGSAIHLMEGIRRAVSFGVPLEQAVHAATIVPARVIGCSREIGSLVKGKAADFDILDRNLQVKAVYINGKCITRENY